MKRRRLSPRKTWVFVAALAASRAVFAADEQRTPGVPVAPTYRQECGACHVAFPPSLLPAASWRRLLDQLPQHYGTDASLDAATVSRLAAWLETHAGTAKRVREAPPEDRITRSPWFIRKHDDVPAAAWKRPAVKGATHCAACHPQAEQGDFDEHAVRIPR